MSELSSISGNGSIHKLTSKQTVALEELQEKKAVETSSEIKEMQQFKVEMQQAFTLMQEIRSSLEASLKNLYP